MYQMHATIDSSSTTPMSPYCCCCCNTSPISPNPEVTQNDSFVSFESSLGEAMQIIDASGNDDNDDGDHQQLNQQNSGESPLVSQSMPERESSSRCHHCNTPLSNHHTTHQNHSPFTPLLPHDAIIKSITTGVISPDDKDSRIYILKSGIQNLCREYERGGDGQQHQGGEEQSQQQNATVSPLNLESLIHIVSVLFSSACIGSQYLSESHHQTKSTQSSELTQPRMKHKLEKLKWALDGKLEKFRTFSAELKRLLRLYMIEELNPSATGRRENTHSQPTRLETETQDSFTPSRSHISLMEGNLLVAPDTVSLNTLLKIFFRVKGTDNIVHSSIRLLRHEEKRFISVKQLSSNISLLLHRDEGTQTNDMEASAFNDTNNTSSEHLEASHEVSSPTAAASLQTKSSSPLESFHTQQQLIAQYSSTLVNQSQQIKKLKERLRDIYMEHDEMKKQYDRKLEKQQQQIEELDTKLTLERQKHATEVKKRLFYKQELEEQVRNFSRELQETQAGYEQFLGEYERLKRENKRMGERFSLEQQHQAALYEKRLRSLSVKR